jgi:PPP family 3-phenylpropionic acid transporter
MSIAQSALLAKAFYFFFYAAQSSLIPFLALYYAQFGFSASQIGLLSGVLPLITLVSAPLWGGLADVTQKHRRLLMLAIAGAWTAVLALSLATRFFWLFPIVAVYAVFMAPIMPLVDNAVIAMLGERKAEYGKLRVWGAVGWGVAAPVAGLLIDRNGLDWAFYAYLMLMVGCLVVATRLPVGHTSIGRHFWRGVRVLTTNRQWNVFLLTVMVGFLAMAFEMNFLFLYLDELGAGTTLMGLSLSVATLSEIPVWFYSDRLLARWGTRGLLGLALLATAAQAFAYSLIRDPWLVLPVQVLHGPAFSAMWAAGVAYASDIAPPGMGATAQGVFAGVGMGLRSALGAFIGGLLYDLWGPVAMFRWGGVIALLALAFFFLVGNAQGGRSSRVGENRIK